MQTLLIKNGTVVTLGEANRVIEDGAVLVEGARISRIGKTCDLDEASGTVLDAGGKVILPGFINAHMHFYSTMVRGLGKFEPATDFNDVLKKVWWRLDRVLGLEDCYYSALVALLGAIRKGTTTLIDHHASPHAIDGSLDAIARAVRESGLRACLCYEVSDRDGPEIADRGIRENVRFLEKCRSVGDDYVKALFGLHASFTVSEATLRRAVDAARELETGFHLHVAEARSDQDHALETFGMRVVERLERRGVLGPRTIAAHCVHIDDHEMEILKSTDTSVVHNPQSNINNAVGVADLIGMTERGITVGLGTDAMTVNMLEELRQALWIHHLARQDPSVGFMEAMRALTVGNAAIAERCWGLGLGELREGCAADIILMRYDPPTPFDEETVLGHLAFGLSQAAVDTTIVGGRVLMENQVLKLDIDEVEIARQSRDLARRLWQRL
jgi:putative selenium metabolism protein SsnA